MIEMKGLTLKTTPLQAACIDIALKNPIAMKKEEDEYREFIMHLIHVCLGFIIANDGSASAEKICNELINKIEFEFVSERESETQH